MKSINVRRGFNRIFAVLVALWALYWLFVAPILMARQGKTHYDDDRKSCYEMYGASGTMPGVLALDECLAGSAREFKIGLYSGFGFTWDAGESWSYRRYYRHL